MKHMTHKLDDVKKHVSKQNISMNKHNICETCNKGETYNPQSKKCENKERNANQRFDPGNNSRK